MPTVLCYGDSNTHGTRPMTDLDIQHRYGPDERWTGILRRELGSGWTVIDEGLPGRTTVHDDPLEGAHKNGRRYLQACLESHRPLDAIVLMLGTNDLKARFSLSPADIAGGVGELLKIIAAAEAGPATASGVKRPRVLLLSPPPLGKLDLLAGMFEGGTEKSRRLASLYAEVAARRGAEFLDTGPIIRSSDIDGIHFDLDALEPLGEAVAARLKSMFR